MTDEDDGPSNMEVDTPSSTTSTTTTKKKETVNPSASAEDASKDPDMALAQSIHRLLLQDDDFRGKEDPAPIFTKITDDLENPSLYRQLATSLSDHDNNTTTQQHPQLSKERLAALDTQHKDTLATLESKVAEARDSAGDMEVLDARRRVARFASRSLSLEEAWTAYDRLLALPKLSRGKQMDALLEQSRVANFYDDLKRTAECLDKAQKLADDGGDWDRRNRLKVYRALNFITQRNITTAASLLLDCVATFSCNELCSYTDFIVYTVLTNLLHLPRTKLKDGIIDRPEILALLNDDDSNKEGVDNNIIIVTKLASSLYHCHYNDYLYAIVQLQPVLVRDRFLSPHAGYLLRELHVLGYKQFLDSYRSVTLESMAASFGLSTTYLDLQLSRFISAGRLSAKIDSFGGVVETNRPDEKNAQYRDMIQKGDLLLNRIQKLTRVVDL